MWSVSGERREADNYYKSRLTMGGYEKNDDVYPITRRGSQFRGTTMEQASSSVRGYVRVAASGIATP